MSQRVDSAKSSILFSTSYPSLPLFDRCVFVATVTQEGLRLQLLVLKYNKCVHVCVQRLYSSPVPAFFFRKHSYVRLHAHTQRRCLSRINDLNIPFLILIRLSP